MWTPQGSSGALLLLLAGLIVVAPIPAMAEGCWDCDSAAHCVSDYDMDWCNCTTRLIGDHTYICLTSDPNCNDPQNPCGGGGGPDVVPYILLGEGTPFAGLQTSEPVLAGLLSAAIPKSSPHLLILKPWLRGTAVSEHGAYKHHGTFFASPSGTVGFIFELESLADHSSLSYSGVISDGGRTVSYTKVTQSSPGVKTEVVKATWPATP